MPLDYLAGILFMLPSRPPLSLPSLSFSLSLSLSLSLLSVCSFHKNGNVSEEYDDDDVVVVVVVADDDDDDDDDAEDDDDMGYYRSNID